MKIIEPSVATHIRLPESLNNRLNKLAKKLKTTKAELIRELLKKGVITL